MYRILNVCTESEVVVHAIGWIVNVHLHQPPMLWRLDHACQ